MYVYYAIYIYISMAEMDSDHMLEHVPPSHIARHQEDHQHVW